VKTSCSSPERPTIELCGLQDSVDNGTVLGEFWNIAHYLHHVLVYDAERAYYPSLRKDRTSSSLESAFWMTTDDQL
jgi:hypothetical protein